MDKKISILAGDALPFRELRRLKAIRKELEAQTLPEVEIDLEGWQKQVEEDLKKEMEQIALNIASTASRQHQDAWSVEAVEASVIEMVNRWVTTLMQPFVKLNYLPLIVEKLKQVIRAREVVIFERRFLAVDPGIRKWEAKMLNPFSPELINVDPRFPADRVGEGDFRYYDKWLTEALKSKPIFFDQENYIDKLLEFYEKIYLAAYFKEKEGEKAEVEPKIAPAPGSPSLPVWDPFESNEDSRPPGRNSIIYGGRR